MQAIFFALISYFGWAVGDIFGTIATRKIGAYSTTLWFLAIQIPLFAIIAFFFLDQLPKITLPLFALNVILGLIGMIGLVAFYEGLKIASASLVGTIAASFAALTVILSLIFLGEKLTASQSAAILLVFVGLIISTLDFKEFRNRKIFTGRGVLMSLIAMVTWGVYWTFIKLPVESYGWFWPSYISTAVSIPAIYAYVKFKRIKIANINSKEAFWPLVLNSLLLGIGALSFNSALDKGLTAIVAPISGAYPTLFVLLAFFVFKDQISRKEILGILITLVGIVLLSLAST